jgi:hypothetical protein
MKPELSRKLKLALFIGVYMLHMAFLANVLSFQANRILAGIKSGDKIKVEQIGHKKLLTLPEYRRMMKHKLPDQNASVKFKCTGPTQLIGYLSPSIEDANLVRYNPAAWQVHSSDYYQRYLRCGTLLI